MNQQQAENINAINALAGRSSPTDGGSSCRTQPEQMPKMWGELSTEEKIERTREQVSAAQAHASTLYDHIIELYGLRDELRAHQHATDGRVMVPAGQAGYGTPSAKRVKDCDGLDPSKVYF